MEQTDRLSDGWIVSFQEPVAERKEALHLLGNRQYPSLATAEAGECTVIFAGVLYNGEEFSGAATTGVGEAETNAATQILYAYLRYGEEVLSRIRGVFVLFIWDGKRDILLCVRDPLGMYPLFYAYAGRELLLSSSLESLIRHPQVSAAVNRAALADHLCHRWPKLQETFFAHVNRIPPGHVLQLANRRSRVYRYWDPAPPHQEVHWLKEDESGRFALLFDQAVSRCLDMGPAAIYLSGGLDSVSVAAVAAEQCRSRGRQPPLALSLVFPDAECNEETVQRSVAHGLGLPQVLASFDEAVGSQGMLRAALDMSSKWSMPLLNTYYPAYHFLGLEGQQRGYKTILTGGGGDEWLSVSPYYAADLLRRLHLRGLYQLWNNMQRSYPLPRLVLLRNVLWKFGARLLLGEMVKKRAPWVFHIRRRLLQSPPRWVAPDPVLRREITQRAEESGGNPDVESLYEREMRRALDHPLVSWEMEEAFESGRRLGMTVRQPFWDAELVELLYRTPPELLDRGGRAKGLVRQMVARRFPGLGFERQKKVLATNFFNARVLQEGKDAWQAMGGASALAQLGIVEEGSLRSTVTGILVRNDRRKAFHIWDVLNLEAWLRTRL